jgi:hypothetical protein
MAQEDSMALNCRVRIDKKVHPSLYQELESLGRRDRCERLRSLAQQGLLAEALGVDVVAAAATGGTSRPKRAKRKVTQQGRQAEASSAQESQVMPTDQASDVPLSASDDRGEAMGFSPASEPAGPSGAAAGNDLNATGPAGGDRPDPLRSSSHRLMGKAGMLAPDNSQGDNRGS